MSKARDSVEDLKTLDANLASKLPKSGGALTGAVTTNSTFDGVAIATRDGILTSTTATANAALPKAGGTMTGVIAGFESTGIDDNATSTAITIDASENVLVGKSSQASSSSGCELLSNGTAQFTRDGNSGLRINRLTSDGELIRLSKDGTTVGSINTGSSRIGLSSGDTGIMCAADLDAIYPLNALSGRDAAIDLGLAGVRFKNLYLSGTVTSALANITNAGAVDALTKYSNSNVSAGWSLGAASDGKFKLVQNGVANRIVVTTTGNVGLGVTPSTSWHSNHVALQLGGGKDGFISAPKGQNIGRMFMGVNAVSTDANGNNWSRGGDTYRPSLYSQINGVHAFKTAAAGSGAISWNTAMTIDNNGNTRWGAVTGTGNGVDINPGTNYTLRCSKAGVSETDQILFYNANGNVGQIRTSGTSTSYNTSSDYRLKTDVQPMTGATATFMQLKPVNFEWIADGTRVDGFLAHELGEVIPAAATGSKDGMMDEEYEVSPATGDVYTAAIEEVATESQVMETVEAGSYVNLAGETIVETEERGVTTDLVETIVQREDVDGLSTEVEVEVTTQVPTMETVITTPAVSEVIHSSDVEQPETLEDGQAWRETTAQVMATRSIPDMQGIDQAKVVPLLVATIQELIARVEALEAVG